MKGQKNWIKWEKKITALFCSSRCWKDIVAVKKNTLTFWPQTVRPNAPTLATQTFLLQLHSAGQEFKKQNGQTVKTEHSHSLLGHVWRWCSWRMLQQHEAVSPAFTGRSHTLHHLTLHMLPLWARFYRSSLIGERETDDLHRRTQDRHGELRVACDQHGAHLVPLPKPMRRKWTLTDLTSPSILQHECDFHHKRERRFILTESCVLGWWFWLSIYYLW